jgi:hydrogenase-4 component B
MSHVGTGCLVAGFFALVAASGSMRFRRCSQAAIVAHQEGLFVLFFVIRRDVVPLHLAAGPGGAAMFGLMSAVLITTGIYGLFRVCAFGLGVPGVNWGLAVMGIGTISAILGVLYALTQSDVKRLLAYSTIENTGIIVLGLGVGMVARAQGDRRLATIAIAASLAHVMNHAVFKGLLFPGAGSVIDGDRQRHINSSAAC